MMIRIQELSSKEIIDLKSQLKRLGLILDFRIAKVVLDERYRGKPLNLLKKQHVFYQVHTKDAAPGKAESMTDDENGPRKRGDLEHITVQNGTGRTIIAVDKKQFKIWSKKKIISRPRKFSVWAAFRQLCYLKGLVAP